MFYIKRVAVPGNKGQGIKEINERIWFTSNPHSSCSLVLEYSKSQGKAMNLQKER